MKTFLKAALFGAVLAAAVFFLHFLIPVLLLLLFFGLIRRALFGPRWRHAYAGYGPGCGGAGRFGPQANWSQRTPTVDGRDWQRPGTTDAQGRDEQVY
jgi:hypothetical protein